MNAEKGKPTGLSSARWADPMLEVRLDTQEGPAQEYLFPTGSTRLIAGRSREAQIQLIDDRVSGRHLEFFRDEGGHPMVRELGSTNGTLLDGVRLPAGQMMVLRHGSTLQLGQVLIQYFDYGGAIPDGINDASRNWDKTSLLDENFDQVAQDQSGEEDGALQDRAPVQDRVQEHDPVDAPKVQPIRPVASDPLQGHGWVVAVSIGLAVGLILLALSILLVSY